MRGRLVVSISIILAALIIAFAIFASEISPHWQLVVASSGPENSTIILRIETRTGEIEHCAPKKDDNEFARLAPGYDPNFAIIVPCYSLASKVGIRSWYERWMLFFW